MTPKRIQRKRTKGWKMPRNSIYVGRPSRWGNHWKITKEMDAAECVRRYEKWLLSFTKFNLFVFLMNLRGLDLVCFCPLDQPCHADVLLRLANEVSA